MGLAESYGGASLGGLFSAAVAEMGFGIGLPEKNKSARQVGFVENRRTNVFTKIKQHVRGFNMVCTYAMYF